MPQAPKDLRLQMKQRFGGIGPDGPIEYLESNGYRLTDRFTWIVPNQYVSPGPEQDMDCVMFLMLEWDFGGLEPYDSETNQTEEENADTID